VLDWRDKTIARFGEGGISAVDAIDIVRGSETLSLKKTGSDWTAADGTKLQQSKIDDLLGAIDGERAIGFEDSPQVLARYGLDKPRLEVVLHGKDKELARLQFGGNNPNPAGVYLRSVNPAIQTVKKDLYDKLNVRKSDLQEAQPSPAPPAK
jgi:hypothetical protein